MTKKDRSEFILYLKQCTDNQVVGVYAREMQANRRDYATLAQIEMERRGLR